MKGIHFLFLMAGLTGVANAAGTLPERLPVDRFAKLKEKSPFVLGSWGPPPPPPGPSWSENLYIGCAAKWTEGGEDKDWVVIKDRSQPGALIQLFGAGPNSEGYQLVKLMWADDPRKTKADIKKGTDLATVAVDQAAFSVGAVPGPIVRKGQISTPPPNTQGTNSVTRPRVRVINSAPNPPH